MEIVFIAFVIIVVLASPEIVSLVQKWYASRLDKTIGMYNKELDEFFESQEGKEIGDMIGRMVHLIASHEEYENHYDCILLKIREAKVSVICKDAMRKAVDKMVLEAKEMNHE